MKNILKLTVIFTLLFSCTNDNLVSEDINPINFQFEKTAKADIDKISIYLKKTSKEESFNLLQTNGKQKNIELDYNNSVSLNQSNETLVIINQKNIDENAYDNVALSFIKKNGVFKPAVIIRTINESVDIKIAEYYDINNNHLFTTIYDNVNKTVTNYGTLGLNSKTSSVLSAKYSGCGASYGGAVMECMEDVYTNHGWLSVWVTVQSAFIPQTAAAFAIACAVDAYPGSGECYDQF